MSSATAPPVASDPATIDERNRCFMGILCNNPKKFEVYTRDTGRTGRGPRALIAAGCRTLGASTTGPGYRYGLDRA